MIFQVHSQAIGILFLIFLVYCTLGFFAEKRKSKKYYQEIVRLVEINNSLVIEKRVGDCSLFKDEDIKTLMVLLHPDIHIGRRKNMAEEMFKKVSNMLSK